ncbi:YCF48-related protein [Paucibacter sp. R3-3]|uniref:YCF48-related protein n=1 Tax=Roseateles agri TaxID=3098619 RepID=A0ABU5DR56_9BURK|nr:YCF48-related protein [Paucibacter sp. R3-3]MDY0748125.1 YCF48-related protein [Paucibacter sp. R3-3]
MILSSILRPLVAGLLSVGMTLMVVSDAAGTASRTRPDPLDVAARPTSFTKGWATTGIARQGKQLLAVGPRGLILASVDGAATWTQEESPVSTDLVTVRFTAPKTAWAIGHDGVALRSTDSGQHWERILDGRKLFALLKSSYEPRAKAGDAGAAAVLKEVERSAEQSATPGVLPTPMLDLWFSPETPSEGLMVGAFGLVLATHDGGTSWEPLIERTDNDRRFHLYAVGGQGEERYIAGEQGLLMRWDAAQQRFAKVETPYAGSYFGIDVMPGRLIAYGLRGNAYASEDGGTHWNKIETGVDDNLVALVPRAKGDFLLISQSGQVLAVPQGGLTAKALHVTPTSEIFAATDTGGQQLVLAQINGLRTIELPTR